jgi:hypothetical protein
VSAAIRLSRRSAESLIVTSLPMLPVDALAAFLTTVVESADRLDLLLLLHRTAPRSWNASNAAREVQMTMEAVERELEALCARGLLTVTIGADVSYAFKPLDTDHEALTKSVSELHDSRRDEVRALLRARSV